jgi:DNA-binding transcriptional ArsR family regulator
MLADAAIAPLAALLADPARVAMLWALCDGREVAASELALVAGVTPSTASIHLGKLAAGGLIAARPQGRHRHYRLARPELVQALEALAVLAPPAAPRTHRQARIGRAVRAARTCYDHLAGRLGVDLTVALLERGALEAAGGWFELTPPGSRLLADFGVDVEAARGCRRAFAPACLDWSERVPHVAGALGAALLARLLSLGWLERTPASRALSVTLAGRRGLARTFGLRAG